MLFQAWAWTGADGPAAFLEAFGHLRVQVAPAVGAQSLPRIVTIREFWTDPGLRNRTAVDFNGGELYAELAPYTEPPPLAVLSRAVMLEPCLSIGRGGSGTALHWHDENWLAHLHGAKTWVTKSAIALIETPQVSRYRNCQKAC